MACLPRAGALRLQHLPLVRSLLYPALMPRGPLCPPLFATGGSDPATAPNAQPLAATGGSDSAPNGQQLLVPRRDPPTNPADALACAKDLCWSVVISIAVAVLVMYLVIKLISSADSLWQMLSRGRCGACIGLNPKGVVIYVIVGFARRAVLIIVSTLIRPHSEATNVASWPFPVHNRVLQC